MAVHHPTYYEIEKLYHMLFNYRKQWDDYTSKGRKFAYYALQKQLTEAKRQESR